MMVHEVGLQWDESSGKLLVKLSLQGDPECVSKLSSCIMALWEFIQFTDSRWLTVGTS